MKRFLKSCLLLLFSLATNAQIKQQYSLYFELNACEPKDDISKVLMLFGDSGPIELEVYGYTDFIGSEHANIILSECRAEFVGRFLENALNERIQSIYFSGKGELASAVETKDGAPKNRRVDIFYTVHPILSNRIEDDLVVENQQEISDILTIDSTSNENIVLEGLQFIPGRHIPLESSEPILNRLLQTLRIHESLTIEIQGFICCDYSVYDGIDNDTQEPRLSENRARYVYDYLIREGIDASRLRYKGYGSTKPKVYPEQSPEDQQTNRRVEIKILTF